MNYAVYWPICLMYLVFEIFKVIVTKMSKMAYLLFPVLFIGMNWLAGDENLLVLCDIFDKEHWISYLSSTIGEMGTVFEVIIGSLTMILAKLLLFILPPLFISILFYRFSERFSQSIDWIGFERTFQEIIKALKSKTKKQTNDSKTLFIKKKIPLAFVNIVCVVLLGAMIHFVPLGIKWLGETTGYSDMNFDSDAQQYDSESQQNDLDSQQNGTESESEIEDIYMVITAANLANIRGGVGTGYDVIATAEPGKQFLWTGNQSDDENGATWYQIYLDAEKTQTGWVNMSVIKFVEN